MKITEYINELFWKTFINKNSNLGKNCNSRLHYGQIFQSVGQFLLDIIYPEKDHCLNCGSDLFFTEVPGLCSECLQQIDFLTDFCQHCGRKIGPVQEVKAKQQITGNLCSYCQNHTSSFMQARSVALYNGLFRELILNYKYNDMKKLVQPLAHILKLYCYKYYKNNVIDYLVAIPLHERKLEIRGFNQARLLAEEVAKNTAIPLLEDGLLRVKDSPALYNLDQSQRQQVITGVFRYNSQGYAVYRGSRNGNGYKNTDNEECDIKGSNIPGIEDKNILLIDDIYTTGTTVNEAARVLQNNGAGDIYVLTLATADLS